MLCNTYPVPICDKGSKAGRKRGMMHNRHKENERGGERTRNGEEGVSAAATASAAIRYSDTADASGRRWRRQSAFSILRASTGPTTTGRGFPWKRRITTEA